LEKLPKLQNMRLILKSYQIMSALILQIGEGFLKSGVKSCDVWMAPKNVVAAEAFGE
jgi:hypothetical protein